MMNNMKIFGLIVMIIICISIPFVIKFVGISYIFGNMVLDAIIIGITINAIAFYVICKFKLYDAD